MSVLLVLKLGKGNWLQGFPNVIVQLSEREDSIPIQLTGTLPPDLQLKELYSNWRNLYEALAECSSFRSSQNSQSIDTIVFDEGDVLQFSDAEFLKLCQQLKDRLNYWLNYKDFSRIEHHLRTALNHQDSIRVVIETENETLLQFPWHLWRFFEDYPQAEMALSSQEYQRVQNIFSNSAPNVRILAILGNSEGIDVQQDRLLLEQLPDAEVVFLVEPKRRELDRWLWDEQGWDILFFAGHSLTQHEEERGYLEINPQEKISLDQLKNALQRAINRGLKLAIFNSCDGLGLARQLSSLYIPQIIVMRESVPDFVAQEFFKNFLVAFRKGQSFYLSVREARERLQGLEDEFPCASWLPTICQNPAETPLTWQQLKGKQETEPLIFQHPWRYVGLTSIVVTGLIMVIRWLGLLQTWELKAFDTLMTQRPKEIPDERLLIIGVDDEDIRRYGYPLSDEVLAQLLQKLNTYQPAVIGLDIFRDQPVFPKESQKTSPLNSLFKQSENLVAICAFGPNLSESIAPPSTISQERVGFINLFDDRQLTGDQDDTVRRYLLSRSANPLENPSHCNTTYSLAWQLAYRYLKSQEIPVETAGDNWKFGSVIIQRLKNRNGGYQTLDGRGNQLLINYRSSPQIAQQLSLRDVMEGSDYFKSAWVKERLVLVGMTAKSVPDLHDTPYGEIRGIYIHAHVASQLLSSVAKEKRPLLWWLPQWGDMILVWFWSGIAGLTVWSFRIPMHLWMLFSLELIILWGVCLFILTEGGWLPLVPSALALISTGGIVYVLVSLKI